MIGCGIDFETQGFKAGTDLPTECGAILFDTADFKRLAGTNHLLWHSEYPPQPKKIIEITGITDEMLKEKGIHPREFFVTFVAHLISFDVAFFVAHNAPFDRSFFKVEMEKLRGVIPDEHIDKVLNLPWICSIKDIKHPEGFKSKKLAHLALDYGCTVNPEELHRADQDVSLMLDMLQRANVNFADMLGYSQTPDVLIRAVVPSPFGPRGDGGVGKEKAKACGFSWQKTPDMTTEYKNCWVKKVKENEIEKEKEALGYEVTIIEKGA